jgi:hypothetical protein
MSVPLDTRIDRVEGWRIAAGAAEPGSAVTRPTLQAAAAMGAVIRDALARAGVDAAGAIRLSFADEAAAPPVAIPVGAIPDTAELALEDATGAPLANANDRAGEDDFEPKILAMARRFAGGQPLDFANASFAELFAWSLAQPAAE